MYRTYKLIFQTLQHVLPKKFGEEQRLDCAEAIALFIAVELKKGSESKYKYYLDTIPTNFDYQLANWPDKYNDFVTDQVVTEKRLVKRTSKYAFEIINATYNAVNPKNTITQEELNQARDIVSTRMLEDGMPKFHPDWLDAPDFCVKLVPAFDMLNHDSEVNCEWENEFGRSAKDHLGSSVSVFRRKRRVYVTSVEPVLEGEPLTIYYG